MPRYARVFFLPDDGVPVRVPVSRYEGIMRGDERVEELAGTTGLFALASMERSSPGNWEVLSVNGKRIQFDKEGLARMAPLEGNDLDLAQRPRARIREDAPSYGRRTLVPVLTEGQRAAVVAAALLSRPRKA